MGLWLLSATKIGLILLLLGHKQIFFVQLPEAQDCQLLGFLFFREKPTAASRDQNAGEGNVSSLPPHPKPFFPVRKHKAAG